MSRITIQGYEFSTGLSLILDKANEFVEALDHATLFDTTKVWKLFAQIMGDVISESRQLTRPDYETDNISLYYVSHPEFSAAAEDAKEALGAMDPEYTRQWQRMFDAFDKVMSTIHVLFKRARSRLVFRSQLRTLAKELFPSIVYCVPRKTSERTEPHMRPMHFTSLLQWMGTFM